jgi:hypothetical protein
MNQTNISVPKYRRYWPVPPLIDHIYEYQDVNKDVHLRKSVTDYFQEKILNWINTESDFSKYKSKTKFFESDEGYMHIYHLLRHFIKRSKINWYDLRDNSKIIKSYMLKHL